MNAIRKSQGACSCKPKIGNWQLNLEINKGGRVVDRVNDSDRMQIVTSPVEEASDCE